VTRRRILLFLLTIFTLLAGVLTTPASAAGRGRELQPFLDELTKSQAATAAIAEFRDGRTVWRGSSGVAQLGRSRPAPVDGRFRIGSVTKTFVATVVLQLVAEGKAGLDDTLDQRLPGLVPRSDRITVRHLLQHTSGIEDYPQFLYSSLEDFLAKRLRTYQPRELVAIGAARPPLFEPGTSWSYSNTNYVLLGLLIERITGKRFETVVSQRVLQPLGLRDTIAPGTGPFIRGPHAHGYLPVENNGVIEPFDVTVLNPSAPWTAGGMISTTADLNRFYGALLGGRLLPAAQLREMTTNLAVAQYGLGIFRTDLPCGITLWGHNGGIQGYATMAFTTADARSQLTISVNPWVGGAPNDVLDDLISTAFCGHALPGFDLGRVAVNG
jgi:D-alanyl-D-alanine carboxypeptidase